MYTGFGIFFSDPVAYLFLYFNDKHDGSVARYYQPPRLHSLNALPAAIAYTLRACSAALRCSVIAGVCARMRAATARQHQRRGQQRAAMGPRRASRVLIVVSDAMGLSPLRCTTFPSRSMMNFAPAARRTSICLRRDVLTRRRLPALGSAASPTEAHRSST